MILKGRSKPTMLNVAISGCRIQAGQNRHYIHSLLKERLRTIIPQKREEIKEVKMLYGDKSLGNVTVSQVYGGMRGIKGLIYETSLLDPEEGIRFRGYTIPECQKLLPKAANGGLEPLPEGLFYLLLTGEIPGEKEVTSLSMEWEERRKRLPIPSWLKKLLLGGELRDLHPMSQLSIAILALQQNSKFAASHRNSLLTKENQWSDCYEDSSNLISQLPSLASMIYKGTFSKGQTSTSSEGDQVQTTEPHDHIPSDWAGRFAHELGFHDPNFHELLRLYLTIHTDHEGGNVSAHAVKLVGSALSDPYLSMSAGVNGLAGPLHGLANQDVLNWIFALRRSLGNDPSDSQITQYIEGLLGEGQVIPGYGHAVLRKTDPRYTCQADFAAKHLPNDPLIKLTKKLYSIVPGVLERQGKTKNPFPNVDAHSGVLLQHYGLVEQNFYTVLFACSRALGALSGLIWDRALMMPLERPKSMTTESIKKMFKDK